MVIELDAHNRLLVQSAWHRVRAQDQQLQHHDPWKSSPRIGGQA
jgi:hypothetical protein